MRKLLNYLEPSRMYRNLSVWNLCWVTEAHRLWEANGVRGP